MKRAPAAGAAIVLIITAALAVPRAPATRLTIHLRTAAGLYAGSDVRVLGVPIGRVTRVTPEGRTVRVELTYDRRQPAPADAVAVVVQPTLVGERYVQLAPAYTGGPVLADGADLPLARTASPVEPDELLHGLGELGTALGPKGANSDGSLGRLLGTARRNLDGNGAALHTAITGLSSLATAAARADTAGTVRDLEKLAGTLAAGDGQVRDFAADLAAVGSQLDDEKADLAAAVRALTAALGQLAQFVRDNGGALRSDVRALTDLSAVLVRQKDALANLLDLAPTALTNLDRAYDPATGTLAVRDTSAGCAAQATCHSVPAPAPVHPAAPGNALDRTLGGILKGAR